MVPGVLKVDTKMIKDDNLIVDILTLLNIISITL